MTPPASLPSSHARASSGFRRVWEDLEISSETMTVAPGETLSPRAARADTDRRQQVERLPRLPVAGEASGATDLALGDVIGAGGFGVVHAALQRSLQRTVAVKSVRLDAADPASAAADLVREARIAGQLDHPNIVPVHALGLDEAGQPLLVMKRVDGTNWKSLLVLDPPATRPDTATPAADVGPGDALERHLKVLLQVCNAVDFAHSRGIVHRDLKPENVMVGHFGEVYVLDWGVAVQATGERGAELGGIAGTPAYMAPEMVAPTAAGLGPHTDVYLLGALLHAVLTGMPRHNGDNLHAVLYQAWQSEPVAYGPEVPAELADLCNLATAREPERRPASARDFSSKIEEFVRHRDSVRLCDEATARLRDLAALVDATLQAEDDDSIDDDTAALVHRLAGEARFGFQQALRTWDRNARARDGHDAVCGALARFAIAQGDPRSATVLLGQMKAPPGTLLNAVAALEQARHNSALDVQRLQRIEHDMDFESSADLRSQFALAIGVLWALLPGAFGALEDAGYFALTYASYFAAGGLFAAFLTAGVWLGRAVFLRNRANRAFVLALGAAVGGETLARAASWVLGLAVHDAIAYDHVVFFLVLAGMAATMDTKLVWAALVYAVGAVAVVVAPHWALYVTAVANLVALGLVAWVWKPKLAGESKRRRLLRTIHQAHACLGDAVWKGLQVATGPVARAAGPMLRAADSAVRAADSAVRAADSAVRAADSAVRAVVADDPK